LLPPSLRDWLPQDHLAYFISDTIDQLDLSAFHVRYEGDGRRNQPYHPTMLAKVLIYAYATGVFSSRKIAAKLVDDVALRVLAAGNRPDFRTINRFRQQHLETFGKLFIEGSATGPEDGFGEAGNGGAGRHESQGQRLQTQGDELPAQEGRRATAGERNSTVARKSAANRRRRRRAPRP
jgi:transposase